ncbi:RusA family crossover junction endodeoxyribonuclease [Bifidobacterium choerinum]|uniref:RusA family crossover junction endodeoxyribonuclease n=1 Tax=Bifidobacterium choerinum TaxID=35760 RepID=UPI0012FDE7E9|nr:RusA family crossover junction endodeoxyribonuclease [Bifidobacterium choerinum]
MTNPQHAIREPVALLIPGDPVAKGRPRVYHGHGVTPQRTRDAESVIQRLFREEFPGFTPYECRIIVTCEFWMRRKGKPDCDNLIKLCTDALNGIAYQDDEQIEIITGRRYLPDSRIQTEHGWRWRRSKDPCTYYGTPYEPHTLIHITPINNCADHLFRPTRKSKNT